MTNNLKRIALLTVLIYFCCLGCQKEAIDSDLVPAIEASTNTKSTVKTGTDCEMEPFCETAFAEGCWVWTTSKKSNPEGRNSLELTKNRWGWAINLTCDCRVFDIWAGAALNDTSKGIHVGTLKVERDGSKVTVTYSMKDGYCMKEVHLYASVMPPTTIAPGQYGNTEEFDSNETEYTFKVSIEDADSDGIWLIAHAVVCNTCG